MSNSASSGPLAGCVAKIHRAAQHTGDLAEKATDFCKSYRSKYSVLGEFDRAACEYRIKGLGAVIAVPAELSVLCGEIAYQLRSSLDHLLWALVEKNGCKPGRQTQFPIFEDKAKFEDTGLRNLQGVSDAAKAIIRSLQPYTRESPDDSLLALLAELNNVDKHRTLIVTVAAVNVDSMVVANVDPDVRANRPVDFKILTPPKWVEPTKDGDILCRISVSHPKAKVEVKPEVACQIAFDKFGTKKIEPMLPAMHQLREFVLHTLSLFKAEFV